MHSGLIFDITIHLVHERIYPLLNHYGIPYYHLGNICLPSRNAAAPDIAIAMQTEFRHHTGQIGL